MVVNSVLQNNILYIRNKLQ